MKIASFTRCSTETLLDEFELVVRLHSLIAYFGTLRFSPTAVDGEVQVGPAVCLDTDAVQLEDVVCPGVNLHHGCCTPNNVLYYFDGSPSVMCLHIDEI